MEQQLAEQYKTMGSQQKIVRTFNVSRFGIYNSDCPSRRPMGASLDVVYTTNNGASTLNPSTIYLVAHSKNIVYSIQPYQKLTYDPKDSYSLCLFSNGQVYLCNKEEFAYVVKSKQGRIDLKALPDDIEDPADLKKALGI